MKKIYCDICVREIKTFDNSHRINKFASRILGINADHISESLKDVCFDCANKVKLFILNLSKEQQP